MLIVITWRGLNIIAFSSISSNEQNTQYNYFDLEQLDVVH